MTSYSGIGWVIILFILPFFTIDSYAQKYPTTTKDSFPISTEDVYEDPLVLYEKKAAKRALRQKNRRLAYRSRLPKNHNPRTAALLALIPGAGQIYNRRYWKAPIAIGGIGVLGYFMVTTKSKFECYKRDYLHRVDNNPNTNYSCPQASSITDSLTLKLRRDQLRTTSEYMIIGFTIYYGLTIIDAFVDAHLAKFDIDDDLSLQIQPSLYYNSLERQWTPSIGLSVTPRVVAKQAYPIKF